jgi:hypothetical protein
VTVIIRKEEIFITFMGSYSDGRPWHSASVPSRRASWTGGDRCWGGACTVVSEGRERPDRVMRGRLKFI